MPDTQILRPRPVREPETVEPAAVPSKPMGRPSYGAFRVLHVGFTILPFLAGLDKFFDLMTPWTMYLARPVENFLPFSGRTFMYAVGVTEIAAAVLVAVRPLIGAFVVAAWLAGITFNLLLSPAFYDIALRDFGLMLGAIALGLLAREYERTSPAGEPVETHPAP